ncbi:hypothetical protein Aduo_002458 [Ancylostoma duodenale]
MPFVEDLPPATVIARAIVEIVATSPQQHREDSLRVSVNYNFEQTSIIFEVDDFHTPPSGSPISGAGLSSISDSLSSTHYSFDHLNSQSLCVNEDDFSQDESEPLSSQVVPLVRRVSESLKVSGTWLPNGSFLSCTVKNVGTPREEDSELDEFSE